MSFEIFWLPKAQTQYQELKSSAKKSYFSDEKLRKKKSSKQEGRYKQVYKCINYLRKNPKHPGLNSHVFKSMVHPFDKSKNVFESYAQNKTAGAYRIFWCYGAEKNEITIIAITPHA
jgi:hypothetical protein